jgi:hypothetical protein
MMLLGIDWFVFEGSSRKAKLVVSLCVVGFCFMYNIHDVHLPIFTHKNVFVPRHVLCLSLPNNVWRLIVFAPFLIIIIIIIVLVLVILLSFRAP